MSSIDRTLYIYIYKLKIISNLPTDGKFDTTNGNLTIYKNSLCGWIWRKVNCDNKEKTAIYLMKFYREVSIFTEQIMCNIKAEKNNNKINKKMHMLVLLTEKIKESLYGITKLICTYEDYAQTVHFLEFLVHDIIIKLFNSLKQFIPSYYHTEIIKMDLEFYLKKKYDDMRIKKLKISDTQTKICVSDIKYKIRSKSQHIKSVNKSTYSPSDKSTPPMLIPPRLNNK